MIRTVACQPRVESCCFFSPSFRCTCSWLESRKSGSFSGRSSSRVAGGQHDHQRKEDSSIENNFLWVGEKMQRDYVITAFSFQFRLARCRYLGYYYFSRLGSCLYPSGEVQYTTLTTYQIPVYHISSEHFSITEHILQLKIRLELELMAKGE